MASSTERQQARSSSTKVTTTYRPGRAVVAALQEAEAAFSDVHVQRSAVERIASFFCSKFGITFVSLAIGLSTHWKQAQGFVNTHLLHKSSSISTAAVTDEDRGVEASEPEEEEPRTLLARPIHRAAKNKKAMMDHNASTIQAADEILEGVE